MLTAISKYILPLCTALVALPSAAKGNLPEPKTGHVVMIVLDGWGSYSWEQSNMPATKALAAAGAYTTRQRCILPTISAPNWNSMFKGVSPEQHGYINNSKEPRFAPTVLNEHGCFPTIFSELRRQRPQSEIGVVYEWGDIKYFVDTLALNYCRQGVTDFMRDGFGITNPKILEQFKAQPALTDLAVQYIKDKKPTLLAVCYDEPDGAGHRYGHGSPEYYQAMNMLDGYIARIVQATKDAGIYDNTTFVITADHGGIGHGHGRQSLQEFLTMFILSGKGVNPIGQFEQRMVRFDTAPTVNALLGIDCPQAWTGHAAAWALTAN